MLVLSYGSVVEIRFTRDSGLLTRVIAGIFCRKFDGPFYSWTVTPISHQELYFRTFVGKYN
ncbi:unnamed protein product [Arabis nemorensis]|uniref:Uncharacterized protein n=1 Tax=Arabis nemorensis TaxID=586526 RepID=A0A565CCL1_9BRAS|nr:unnamed protein product [Arabis nemorensis]